MWIFITCLEWLQMCRDRYNWNFYHKTIELFALDLSSGKMNWAIECFWPIEAHPDFCFCSGCSSASWSEAIRHGLASYCKSLDWVWRRGRSGDSAGFVGWNLASEAPVNFSCSRVVGSHMSFFVPWGAALSCFRPGRACVTWRSTDWQFCVYGGGKRQTGTLKMVSDYLKLGLQRKVHFLPFYLCYEGSTPVRY